MIKKNSVILWDYKGNKIKEFKDYDEMFSYLQTHREINKSKLRTHKEDKYE